MIDAHAHLTDRRFADDVPEVLERARTAGIQRVLTAAEDIASSAAAVALAARHAGVRVAVGVHPHRASGWDADAGARIEALARDDHVVAIGEIGMDLSGRSAPPDAQERALRAQLVVAAGLDLPVVLHVRDSGAKVRAILADGPRVRGMVHCYSEGPEELESWLALGLYISFAGTVTYPDSDRLRMAAGLVPENRLLGETDAPYLAPQNVRGRRNEPLYVAATYAALAHNRRAEFAGLVGAIGANARALFGERWGT
jgi:TatD DNase family protein